MSNRQNAMSEIVRFWLESKIGFFVKESVPVKVERNYSDIDFIAISPDYKDREINIVEHDIHILCKRAIIEVKDEHDYDPYGNDFSKSIIYDTTNILEPNNFLPEGIKIRFNMLRKEHFEVAKNIFGTDDFQKILIVHKLNTTGEHTRNGEKFKENINNCLNTLKEHNIFFIEFNSILNDLYKWYRPTSSLRNTFIGDSWHLLVGYYKMDKHNNPFA